jgi:inhibitor of cysteine peptidase
MKRLILLLLVVALFAGSPVLEAKDDATAPRKKVEKSMRLTDADNKKTVALAAGTAFDIALKGNATTGFQWQVGKIEGEAIRQNGKVDYVPDKHPERMVGFGGTFIFHFTLTKAAKAKIRLVYVRPWEKDKPPEKTFEVVINPAPSAAKKDHE